MKNSNLIIISAIILQFITALFVLFNPEALNIASLGIFYKIFSIPSVGALLMLAGAGVATIGLFVSETNKLRILFFLIQYFFLLLVAGSSLHFVMQGMYADGVVRPWQFIFLDQLPQLIIPALYTISIIDFRKEKNGT